MSKVCSEFYAIDGQETEAQDLRLYLRYMEHAHQCEEAAQTCREYLINKNFEMLLWKLNSTISNMRIEKQKFSIPIVNHDQKVSSQQFRKHGDLFGGNSKRALIVGSSNSGKTNLMLTLLEHPNGSRKAVRDKFQALKLASSTAQLELEKAYRPITQPLKEFITNIGKAEPLTFKEEEEFNPKEEFSTPKSSYKTSTPTREKTRKSGKTPILPFEQPSFFDMSINRLPSVREVASLREMPPIREEVTFESSPQSSTETIGNLSDILEQTKQSIQTYVGHPVYLDWLSDFHELPRTYIDDSVKDTEHKFDHNYGIVHDLETNNFFLGSTQIPVNLVNKDIKVLDILYPGTPGLYELLFKKEPVGYKKADLDNYMDILTRTNAYRRNNNPNEQVQGNSSVKYVTIIGPYLYKKGITKSKTIIPRPVFEKPIAPYRAAKKKAQIGKGLILKRNKKSTDYVYWDNVNELVNRLRILLASKAAGHNGHQNEIISIIEELKEAKVIL
ncbi:unnamed protein product [Ceutorhynchus assimilis]|uniref:DUF8207 domain-containing protein n=1 Tax=Ceutorhynchus assimilis TaxID=467358 RepID=A0A9N9MZ97_9CUCU|nr:unnamed protein product [Ceutorhynchus assimilis]